MKLSKYPAQLFSIDMPLFEKRLILSLLACFLYDFGVSLYGLTYIYLGWLEGIHTYKLELSLFLLTDFLVLVLVFIKKLNLRLAIPYFFLSLTFKSFFDLVYTDGGHVILQGVFFFTTLALFVDDKQLRVKIFKFIIIYLLFVYVFSGYQKLWSDDYITGNAILKVLGTPTWSFRYHEVFYQTFFNFPLLPKLIGIMTIAIEFLGPILFIFVPSTRKLFITTLLVFHIMTFLIMDLITFPIFMIILILGILSLPSTITNNKLKVS